MPVSFLSPAQRDSYGQYLGDPSTQELARYFHLDDSDHTQIVEKRGDANRLGFALQLTTVRFVGTFLDDPTAVPPAVLATMSRQLGIDTTTDLTGYRDGKWRFAHAAQIRTEHGYRDLADRAAGRSETPLTAVANRTFRSIAPQTPSSGVSACCDVRGRVAATTSEESGRTPASAAGSSTVPGRLGAQGEPWRGLQSGAFDASLE